MRWSVLVAVLAVMSIGCKKKEESPQAQGRELFVNTCARCHGTEGTGGPPPAPGAPSPRNFHDHEFQLTHTDDQLKQTIRTGKGTAMPAFAGMFNDAQLAALVTHIRSFDDKK